MDSQSLRTASTYLNNLLLARGLLRNGEAVDFVKPSRESRAQIINLVHDLILRGDRDKQQREDSASSLRQLRADESRKNQEIERLSVKHEEAARAVVQAQTAERAAKDENKKVEKAMKSLQEQHAKLKTTLAQMKTQCTNDVRKRDLELARLKTHLQGQQRGNKSAPVAPSITISGGTRKNGFDTSVRDLRDPAYSLKQETTEFLTQLSQSLSEENDSLISLVRGAVETLNELLGISGETKGFPDSGFGETVSEAKTGENKLLHAMPSSYETLAADLDATLTNLKTLLTNPNFVPLEEVEIREEELGRLREGWEKMEQRWRDLLMMMDGWRKRMDTGESINVDDLRRGMGLVSPGRESKDLSAIGEESGEESSLVEDSLHELRRPEKIVKHQRHDIETSGNSAERTTKLRPRAPTALNASPKRKRDVLEPPESFDLRPRSDRQRNHLHDHDDQATAGSANQDPTLFDSRHNTHVSTSKESLSPQMGEADDGEESEELEVPQMSVEDKLSAAAHEAAAVRDSEGDRRSRGRPIDFDAAMDGIADDGRSDDTLGKMRSPVKKTRITGRPRRRKSTLSREELAELLLTADD